MVRACIPQEAMVHSPKTSGWVPPNIKIENCLKAPTSTEFCHHHPLPEPITYMYTVVNLVDPDPTSPVTAASVLVLQTSRGYYTVSDAAINNLPPTRYVASLFVCANRCTLVLDGNGVCVIRKSMLTESVLSVSISV